MRLRCVAEMMRQLIWDRLKALGLEDRYEAILPAKDWRSGRGGGPRKIVR
ncbi:MAG: hypothetical protein R6V84_15060 [Desulfobacterales bacterium]